MKKELQLEIMLEPLPKHLLVAYKKQNQSLITFEKGLIDLETPAVEACIRINGHVDIVVYLE